MDQPGEGGDSVWENFFSTYQKAMSMAPHLLDMRVKWTLGLARICHMIPIDILSRTIPILVQSLSNEYDALTVNKAIQVASVHCLTRMARIGNGRLAAEIGRSGAIGHMMRLTFWAMFHSEDNGFFIKLILKCYAVLVSISDECRVEMYEENGSNTIPLFFRSDRSNMEMTKPYLLEIISAMSMHEDFRKEILTVLGHRHLVDAASVGNSMICRGRACQAMALIGADKDERVFLTRLGAIPVLADLFRNVDGRMKLVVANALGVIASHVDHIKPTSQAGVIPLYAELLQGPDPIGREIAEDVLCLLTVDESSAVSIAEYAARILRDGNFGAKLSAVEVFWSIAVHNHFAPIVRNSGAIPYLLRLLRDENLIMRRKVSEVVAVLSYNKGERDALVEIEGAIPIIEDSSYDEEGRFGMLENCTEALVQIYEDPDHVDKVLEVIDSESIEEMLERYDWILKDKDDDTRRSLRHMRRLLKGPGFV